MDFQGTLFPALVAAVSLGGLWWHFWRARHGPIVGQDKVVAGLWAALLVFALARVLWLVANPGDPAPQ
jgi:hypothetical protein